MMTLFPGDIIMTGTPKNAEKSVINDGDEVKICIENIGELSNKVNLKKRI
jgi:2-keto-4-pentenoate hydratase/2-oxohepta-3-ene-1,7-dioic acid hydratase in catechol pathway